MTLETILKLIKEDPLFIQIFHFDSDSEDEFTCMFSYDELHSASAYLKNWIYLTGLTTAALIGITESDKVIAIDFEGECFTLCTSFYHIPFRLVSLHLGHYRLKEILHSQEHEFYLKNLIQYAQWCSDNEIFIPEGYLKLLEKPSPEEYN